jgi:CheY-like chemotaxis protein
MSESPSTTSCTATCTAAGSGTDHACGETKGSASREMVSSETRNASPSLAPGMRSGTVVPYEERRRGPRVAAWADARGLGVAAVEDDRAAVLDTPSSGGGNLIDLARCRETQEWRENGSAARRGTPRPMILVVDANAALCNDIRERLNACGYDVTIVHSAGEARAALNAFVPALVIAEIDGAERPGHELCARIKATPRLKDIPVILMTYAAGPREYARAYSLGAVVCMPKPFDPERLGHVVQLLVPVPRGN